MSIYSNKKISEDEKQYLLQRENQLGVDIGQRQWGLDRSSPMGALKQIIRDFYTPDTTLSKTNPYAVVLSSEIINPTNYDVAAKGEKPGTANYVLVRIKVISDDRHFWLPDPILGDASDPYLQLYPYARWDKGEIPVGSVVALTYDNQKHQFSSASDVATVTSIVDLAPSLGGGGYRKRTSLCKPDAANYLRGQNLLNDSSFNIALDEVSSDLNVSKADLVRIFEFESQIDPKAFNPKTKRQFPTGLIQFTTNGLGNKYNKDKGTFTGGEYNINKLRKPNGERYIPNSFKPRGKILNPLDISRLDGPQQVYLSRDYFIKNGIRNFRRPPTIAELYLLVLFPKALNKPDNYKLGVKGSDSADAHRTFAKQNPVFGGAQRGYVTRADVVAYITNYPFQFVNRDGKIGCRT